MSLTLLNYVSYDTYSCCTQHAVCCVWPPVALLSLWGLCIYSGDFLFGDESFQSRLDLAKNICLRLCSIDGVHQVTKAENDGQLLRLKLCKSLLQSLKVVIIARIGSTNLRSLQNPLSHHLLISVEVQHTSQDSIRAHYVIPAFDVLFRSWKTIYQESLVEACLYYRLLY